MRALIAAVLLLSSLAFAEVPTLSVSGGYSMQVFAARGFDLIAPTDDVHLGRIAAGTGFRVGFGLLDVEVAYAGGGTRALTQSTVPVQFELQGVQLALAYRLPVLSWLHPYVQLGGGYDWATLTLYSADRLTQTVGSASGSGLVGLQLLVKLGQPKLARAPWLVFDLGLGGVLRQAPNFDAMGPKPADKPPADAIARGTVDVGAVPLSGFTARLLVGVRY
ncbi:MAG: hypothetical protein ACOZQL_00740 [Myxococcota bacterium]